MKPFMLIPKGSMSPEDKKQIRKAGACVVEIDDPSKAVMMLPGVHQLTGDIFVKSLVHSISGISSTAEREKFASKLISLWENSKVIPEEQK